LKIQSIFFRPLNYMTIKKNVKVTLGDYVKFAY